MDPWSFRKNQSGGSSGGSSMQRSGGSSNLGMHKGGGGPAHHAAHGERELPKGGGADGNDSNNGESVILEEEYDPNYEPTQDEIKDYAEFLGMELGEVGIRACSVVATAAHLSPLPVFLIIVCQ
jgi:hypothetical protein